MNISGSDVDKFYTSLNEEQKKFIKEICEFLLFKDAKEKLIKKLFKNKTIKK